jgi:hypothetical protein
MTDPIDEGKPSTAPRLAIAPAYRDPDTGVVYVHKDLVATGSPWDNEAHIGPVEEHVELGDVESWVSYVQRFVSEGGVLPLLTWNKNGFRAVLDYHESLTNPGRAQWIAEQPFILTPEWRAWMLLCDNHAKEQRVAIEALEDRAGDIVSPAQSELMALLRSLRTQINKNASHIEFFSDTNVSARGGTADVPAEFEIAIPVLKGHVNEQGAPVLYKLKVRIRTSPTDQGKLYLRFSIPDAERVFESVLADQVKAAREQLGDNLPLLRAAG